VDGNSVAEERGGRQRNQLFWRVFQAVSSPGKSAKLIAYNLSLDDVYRSIEQNNENAGGNVLDRFDEQYIVRALGLLKSEDDLRNIVLTARVGTPVFVRDVADVQIGEAVRQGAALLNGEGEAVGGIVMMLRGENSREVVERVKAKVREINENNILHPALRSSLTMTAPISFPAASGPSQEPCLEGSMLVVIILYLMLRSLRGAAVVILALSLSLFLTSS